MSKFCRFWLQLSLIYNAIIAVESLFSQAWMMLGNRGDQSLVSDAFDAGAFVGAAFILDDVRDDFPDQCFEPRRSVV